MATNQGISPQFSSQGTRIPGSTPRAEVAELIRAAVASAALQVIADEDVARCASCQATAVRGEELSHSPDCAAERVTAAWAALNSKVRRKPAVSEKVLSPLSAA